MDRYGSLEYILFKFEKERCGSRIRLLVAAMRGQQIETHVPLEAC